MALTAAQAAAAVGMSKQGIIRSIHKGKLSATRDEHGNFVVDPVELYRVYTPATTAVKSDEPVAGNSTVTEATILQEKVSLLERIINDKDDVIQDLRQRLDVESDKSHRLTMLLTTAQQPQQPRSWWQRMWGG